MAVRTGIYGRETWKDAAARVAGHAPQGAWRNGSWRNRVGDHDFNITHDFFPIVQSHLTLHKTVTTLMKLHKITK